MKRSKKEISISVGLILLAVIYTILVKVIDVAAIGPNNSVVGFATINKYINNLTGVNMLWYDITDILGLIPIIIVLIYGLIGFYQLVKRKSIFKVDKELLGLGVLYATIISLYVFFEIIVINYRPVLIDGILEASYPSSHTLLAIGICGSSIMLNNNLFKNKKFFKIENIVSLIGMLLIVGGRLLSGVHWLSDIIGSILISVALLYLLNLYLKSIKRNN